MTDNPPPGKRKEFIDWMVGRDFKLVRADPEESLHLRVVDWYEKTMDVPEGVSPDDLEDLKSNSVFIRYYELSTEEEIIEGKYTTTSITLVNPPDETSTRAKAPFDSVRVQFMKNRLIEL